MAYPPKVDPISKTWVIAIDFKLDRLKEYCLKKEKDLQKCQQLLNSYRAQIFNTFYEIVSQYGFNYRMQNSLVFNNSTDATKAYMAISLGIKNSWIKYFIEKIHLFEIEPNSDASPLLEIEKEPQGNKPDWFTDELKEFLTKENEEDLLF